jgi:hypothetical protein
MGIVLATLVDSFPSSRVCIEEIMEFETRKPIGRATCSFSS